MINSAPHSSCRLAAVQMRSEPGAQLSNMARATEFVRSAKERDAQLVLLPELALAGYIVSPELWKLAEPIGGVSSQWLCAAAREYDIYLGTTLIEVADRHFYNTFVLAGPDGQIAGAVRKSDPAWVEARYYRGDINSHVIETALGRIGLGICFENYLGSHVRMLASCKIDLLLQPTAAATPPPTWPVGARGARAFDTMLSTLAKEHARMLGAPVVMANMCGPLEALDGPLSGMTTQFPGLSSIVASDGEILAQMGGGEGVVSATVELGAKRTAIAPTGFWAAKMPWYAPAWPATQALCSLGYKLDRRRAAAALAVSRAGQQDDQATPISRPPSNI